MEKTSLFQKKKPAGKNRPAKSTKNKAKEREKELAEIAKTEEDAYQKRVAALYEFEEKKAQAIEDGFKREVELEIVRRNKEVFKSKTDISQLKEQIQNAKSKKEQDDLKKQLDTLNKIEEINEDTHQKKLQTIREKYDAKVVQEFVASEQKRIDEDRRSAEEKINGIKSMEDAKLALSKMTYLKLTDQELQGIQTLEDAKRALRENADRAMLAAQSKSLEAQKKKMEEALTQITGEEAEKLKANLEEITKKITQVKGAIQGGEENDEKKVAEESRAKKESVDLLGYSVQDWEDMWGNLKTTEGKMKAIAMATQAMGNAASMYAKLVEKLGQREIQKFEKNQNKKKKALLKQLNQGYINQEKYTKQVELLDVQLANKKAEIAYKTAKAQKAADIITAISGTATAVVGALGSKPWNPANYALAVLVGILGAVQIATISAQPLPEKPSFAEGGYTGIGFGSPDGSGFRPAGIVHENEYVTPEWMMENPVISDVVSWMESIRTGRADLPKGYADGGVTSGEIKTNNKTTAEETSYNTQLYQVLYGLEELLTDLKNNGVDAYMVEDAENGKKIQRATKQFQKIENRNARTSA